MIKQIYIHNLIILNTSLERYTVTLLLQLNYRDIVDSVKDYFTFYNSNSASLG